MSVAVIVCRGGVLPAGADECAAAAGGEVLLVGEGVTEAAASLSAATHVRTCEAGAFRAAAFAGALAPTLAGAERVLLPGSPDGRDLAPRLAAAMGLPLLAGVVRLRGDEVVVSRCSGLAAESVQVEGPFVATLVPGVRGFVPVEQPPVVESIVLTPHDVHDAEVIEVLPPDPATMDLTEAQRIVAGGQGLGSERAFALLAKVGAAIGASLGGTRVASDIGWIDLERQIGTTGVAVDPRLYIAFGISGATQHTAGLGTPDHVVSVNLDASCPMMAMANLALVSDAPAVLERLAEKLGVTDA